MPKRYVLLLCESDLGEADVKGLAEAAGQKYGGAKLIPVDGNPRAVILKGTNKTAPAIREGGLQFGGKALKAVLTSGAIGKLKKRAAGAEVSAVGQVP